MKTKIYVNNRNFIAGTTLKDNLALEDGNTALHACLNPDHVLENRMSLAQSLNCGPEDFVCANQTHSDNFYKVTAEDKGRGARDLSTEVKDTDSLYTFETNLLLCCFTADCVPIVFYNEGNGLIGVIHSGWVGTVKEITLKVLDHLIQNEKCNPEAFHLYIGSALSQDKFEVDYDVYQKFQDLKYAHDFMYLNNETGKYHIDNQLVVNRQCTLMGVPPNHIVIDRTCTYSNGFSYRKDKQCGRHLSFIMKKSW